MKREKIIIGVMLIATLFIGCVPKSKYDELVKENENLKIEVDELKNGEERLISIIDNAYKNNDFETAKANISILSIKHPESKKNAEYETLLKTIEKKENEIAIQKKKEAAEKERLANLNNTGNWRVWNYVDDFGEETKNKYLTHLDDFTGKFSNSATSNSPLKIRFLIDSKDDISVKLYEYSGDTEVKGDYSYPVTAYVTVRDSEGNDSSMLEAKNSSDRFTFGKSASNIIHNILMKGGKIQFSFSTYSYGSEDSSYVFSLSDTQSKYYDNAYRILTTGK